jgi:hypothetical protein
MLPSEPSRSLNGRCVLALSLLLSVAGRQANVAIIAIAL